METPFFIPGPAGQIECLAMQGNAPEQAITAILCHPHPLYGGTMHNKVITTLAQTLRDLGIASVRFNFRGIGASLGQYDEGRGELQDCLAVVDWVKQTSPQNALLLAGFSFGSCIALHAANKITPVALIMVAPPVQKFNCQDAAPIDCPFIIVQGELDEVVSPEAVYAWASERPEKPLLIRMPEATHFFHGKLTPLKQQLTDAIKKYDILSAPSTQR